MVSPVAIRLLVGDQSSSGQRAGFLYFASTVGSSVGTLMTSFYLVLWFEVNTIILAGSRFSLTLGLVTASCWIEGEPERETGRFRASAALAALAASAAVAAPSVQGMLHEGRSLCRNLFSVSQSGDERCLLFRARRNLGRGSCMYLSNPDRFVFPYAEMMAWPRSTCRRQPPKRVLIVGGDWRHPARSRPGLCCPTPRSTSSRSTPPSTAWRASISTTGPTPTPR